jgi:hypothetical protein
MIITGTSYFPTKSDAIKYYVPVCDEDVRLTVEHKIAQGEIHIGKPPIEPGEKLIIKDNRYHIESL